MQKWLVIASATLNAATSFTGVAQGQRARLITLRTPDRNGSPVFLQFSRFIVLPHNPPASSWDVQKWPVLMQTLNSIFRPAGDVKRSITSFTGVAQRKRARLITLRTPDRNGSPVSSSLRLLYQNQAVFAFANDVKLQHRRGASAARKAHNLEVTGSTPVAGILSLRQFYRNRPSSWTLNAAY